MYFIYNYEKSILFIIMSKDNNDKGKVCPECNKEIEEGEDYCSFCKKDEKRKRIEFYREGMRTRFGSVNDNFNLGRGVSNWDENFELKYVTFIEKENKSIDDTNLFVETKSAELRGYNYVKARIELNHANERIYIKLVENSKLVIKDYLKKNSLITTDNINNRSRVQLIFEQDGNLRRGDYLIKGDFNFNTILNSRAEYGYAAIVYKLKSKLRPYKNLVYFGFSKHDVKKRAKKHIWASIAPHGYGPECEYVNFVKLHCAIINVLEDKGIDVEAEYQWLKSKIGTREYEERMEYLFQILKEYFEIETIEIHKRKFTARLNEKYYTKNFINDEGSVGTVENGLNEILGGSDGQYIELPLIDITAMISLGVKPKKIHRLIKKLYLIDVAYETVSERIRDIWESYSEALELFLKPIVESLIKDDYEFKFNKICKVVNRDRSVLREYLKIWYKGRTFPILKRMKKQGILDWSDLSLYVEEERPELRGETLETWNKWAIEGVSCKRIGEQLGFSEETIRQTYKSIPELGDKQEYCELRRREIVKELLPEGWDPKEIMNEKFKMKPKDNYCVKNFYERLFKGITFEEIIKKGKKGVLY